MKKIVKTIALLALFVGIIAMTPSISRASDVDNTFVIPPEQDLCIPLFLNDSSGVQVNFFAVNGSVNFAFLDPNEIMLYGSDHVSNGTINYFASKTGTYSLHFSNLALTGAVLVELRYSVKSWHNVAIWEFTLETPSLFPWLYVLTIVLAVMKLIIDVLDQLNNIKTIIMKPLLEYSEPKLPLGTQQTPKT